MHGTWLRPGQAVALTISAIVCAYNEADYLPACLHSLLAQTRPPDEILVINNASTDETARRGARRCRACAWSTSRARAWSWRARPARWRRRGDMLVYRRRRLPRADDVARARRAALRARARPSSRVTGPYRFYDWDWRGRALIARVRRHASRRRRTSLVHHVLRHRRDPLRRQLRGAARRRWRASAGSTRSIEFHGEDTNLGRRLTPVGPVALCGGVLGLDVGAALSGDGEAARCSGSTCGTSGPRSCGTGRRIDEHLDVRA